MGTIYSYSRLDTYCKCPLKYKYCYIDKIKKETEGIEAFMGSRTHSVLEKLYKDISMHKDNSLDDLLSYYESEWQKNWHNGVQIVKKEYTAQNYKEIGQVAITDYFNRYKPFDDGKIVGLEKKIVIDLNGDKNYRLMGYIDRLVLKDNNYYEIHDYKTSNSLPTQEIFDKDKQLALYQLGVEQMWPDAQKIDLVWHFLRHDKEFRSQRKAEDLELLKKDISGQIDIVEEVITKGKFEPCESNLCNWCDYQELCPKRKHFYKVEPLPPNEYLKEDGVTLVNKYVELKEEKKRLVQEKDNDITKIEEALIVLAKKESYEAVKGSEHKVKIDFGPRLGFPTKTKNPEELLALEKLVKAYGLWDDISRLDTKKLSDNIQCNGLTEDQVKKIRELLIKNEKPKLSISKIKKDNS